MINRRAIFAASPYLREGELSVEDQLRLILEFEGDEGTLIDFVSPDILLVEGVELHLTVKLFKEIISLSVVQVKALTEEELAEGVKLINVFMGLDESEDIKYYSDWNSIMPVLIKIAKVPDEFKILGCFGIHIFRQEVWIDSPIGFRIHSSEDFTSTLEKPLEEKAFEGAIIFIKWYNKNLK